MYIVFKISPLWGVFWLRPLLFEVSFWPCFLYLQQLSERVVRHSNAPNLVCRDFDPPAKIYIHTRQNVSIKDLDIIMHMYFFQAYGYNAHNSWHYLLNHYFFFYSTSWIRTHLLSLFFFVNYHSLVRMI